MDPVGNLLDKLVKEDVVKEGTGLTLGVTSTMMKFLQDPGPYIGALPSPPPPSSPLSLHVGLVSFFFPLKTECVNLYIPYSWLFQGLYISRICSD